MSYEFTGRYSPSQIASGLQTYGSTGAAMSPEQNNPVQMPQNQAKTPADDDSAWTQWTGGSYNPNADSGGNQALAGLAYAKNHPELQQQAIDYGLNTWFGGNAPQFMPWAPKQWDDYSNPEKIAYIGQTIPQYANNDRILQQQENNRIDTGDWNDPIGDAARGSSALWADTAYDPNVYNPTVRADQYAAQKSQSDFYNQNGGWLKQGGMGGNDLGNVDFDTRYEQGGMGGNDLGDVDLTKRQTPQEDYAFTAQSPEQNSPTEQKGNWLQKITRNPVNKDLAIMASNLVMPGMGKIWGANAAPTYSTSPNTTFGQKAAHVADNFVRNLPIVGTPYALATDLYRQSHASTDPYSRPAMQSNFEKWAPTVPYGNGMDMADPSYLQNQALAKAMADRGIGQQYSFTGGK